MILTVLHVLQWAFTLVAIPLFGLLLWSLIKEVHR